MNHHSIDLTPAQGHQWCLRADFLDFTATPQWGRLDDPAVRFRRDHWLLVRQGRIVDVLDHAPGNDWPVVDQRGCLVLPGFIDTHVHSPQLDVLASYGTELLDWLNTYTFPAEARYADPSWAREGTQRFVRALLAHGTTSALVFPTVHAHTADLLFEQAQERHMRLITGQVLMDRHAPEELLQDLSRTERELRAGIERWHGQGRCAYALTPRFAPTSTPEQLSLAGRLCASDASLYLQTHVAENTAELQWVAELFPKARSYLDVYREHGLLHERSVLAHGIWLDDEDRQTLARLGSSIAHSPTSNLFLGSGLLDWQACQEAHVAVSVASDVGGGTSLCLLRNLAAAYQIQALRGQRLTAWTALHAATAGAARSLLLHDEIGRLEPGLMADLCVWDWSVGEVQTHRDAQATSLHERVFAWMMLSDERHLRLSCVAGRPAWNTITV